MIQQWFTNGNLSCLGLAGLEGGEGGTWRSVFSSIKKWFYLFCFEIPVWSILIHKCNNKLKGQSHCSRAGIRFLIIWGGKQTDIGHSRLWLKVWDNDQKTFTSACMMDKMTKCGKRDWNSLMKPQAGSWSSPPAPAGVAAWFAKVASPFFWKRREGDNQWDSCSKRGQGREKERKQLCLVRGNEMLLVPKEPESPPLLPLATLVPLQKNKPQKSQEK